MMSTQEQHKQPADDEIRAARIAGFTASISHLSPVRRERWLEVYQKQDARREANLANLRVRTECREIDTRLLEGALDELPDL